MKKTSIIILMLISLTACKQTEENFKKIEMEFDNEYYQIASPYKKSIGGNYVVNNNLNNYDINDIETSFMMLSNNYFKTTNSLYQEGQYLNREELKQLLSHDKLNNHETIKVGPKKIKPYYLSSIYEQNYLAPNNNLKGITIGLIFNPYQSYENEFGSYNYEEVDEKTLEPLIKTSANEIIKYLRKKDELKDLKIVIGAYVLSSPNSMLPGNIKYAGITTIDSVELNKINYEYHYLNSNHVLDSDINVYNAFLKLEKDIKKVKDTISIVAKGLYYENKIQNIEITLYSGTFNNSELLYLSELINKAMGNFENRLNIRVIIKTNDKIAAFIHKESNSLKSNIYILGG